tara:strand:+ start:73 stop:219 length:147 start_codon:yes stop_codon:yes gene_type:complete
LEIAAPFSQYMVEKVEKDVAKPNVESVLKSVESVEKKELRSVENKYNN